jgi:hypothetical protein
MSDPTPPFPEEVLTEIGRVAVAATKLEFMLAQFASEICGNMPAADLLSRPGRVLPAARQAADSLEPSIARLFRQWVDHAEQLLRSVSGTMDNASRVVAEIFENVSVHQIGHIFFVLLRQAVGALVKEVDYSHVDKPQCPTTCLVAANISGGGVRRDRGGFE